MGRKQSARRGFPASYKQLCLGDRLNWLRGDECGALVAAGNLQVDQVTAERRRLEKTEVAIRGRAPSAAILDDFRHGQPFPPRADNPSEQMRKAGVVFIRAEIPTLWPAGYLVGRSRATYDVMVFQTERRKECLDLQMDRQETVSPSALARQHLEAYGERLLEMKLEPEEPEALCLEITNYLATGEIATSQNIEF